MLLSLLSSSLLLLYLGGGKGRGGKVSARAERARIVVPLMRNVHGDVCAKRDNILVTFGWNIRARARAHPRAHERITLFRSRDAISKLFERPQIQGTNVSDLRRRASAFARSLLIVRLCSARCRTQVRDILAATNGRKIEDCTRKGGRALNKITLGRQRRGKGGEK